MLKKVAAGLLMSAFVSLAYAQDAPGPRGDQPQATPEQGGAPAGARAGRAAGGRGQSPNLPTQEQWDNMPAAGKAWVSKAEAAAGDDNDLKFDESIFCQADGGATNNDRAHLGVAVGSPFPPFPAPEPAKVMPPQHLFDNMWWFGNTGVGAWLFTSKDGYILFDTMDNAEEARDIIVGGMKKVGLDPTKIKYVIFGHWHGDHTGGGHYIQSNYHPIAIMGRDDWELYYKMMDQAKTGQGMGSRMDDKVPMTHDRDAVDGEKINLGDLHATVYQMTGHTPGSIGMVINVKWAGKMHNVLIVTAGTDFHNINALIGGYEHIWNEGVKQKVESVMQVHPNTNINSLARVQYVNDNFDKLEKSGKNPLLYGVDKTKRYIDIMDDCSMARAETLGWVK